MPEPENDAEFGFKGDLDDFPEVVLDHDQNGRTLYVRGRDVEEKETAVTFCDGSWLILGNAADVRRSDERRVILKTLTDNGEPMTPAELVSTTGQPSTNIRQLLMKMAKSGEVYKVGKHKYWITPDPDNNDHSDNDRILSALAKIFRASPIGARRAR